MNKLSNRSSKERKRKLKKAELYCQHSKQINGFFVELMCHFFCFGPQQQQLFAAIMVGGIYCQLLCNISGWPNTQIQNEIKRLRSFLVYSYIQINKVAPLVSFFEASSRQFLLDNTLYVALYVAPIHNQLPYFGFYSVVKVAPSMLRPLCNP